MVTTVAIVGSREFGNLQAVRDYVALLSSGTVVVSGGARGVDRTAVEAAQECGLPVVVIEPEWDYWGRHTAGKRRNLKVIADADKVVAFWDGKSGGTKHAIDAARLTGIPVEVRS